MYFHTRKCIAFLCLEMQRASLFGSIYTGLPFPFAYDQYTTFPSTCPFCQPSSLGPVANVYIPSECRVLNTARRTLSVLDVCITRTDRIGAGQPVFDAYTPVHDAKPIHVHPSARCKTNTRAYSAGRDEQRYTADGPYIKLAPIIPGRSPTSARYAAIY